MRPTKTRCDSLTLRAVFVSALCAVARSERASRGGVPGDDAMPRYVVHLREPTAMDSSSLTPTRLTTMTASDGKRYSCAIPLRESEIESELEEGEVGDFVESDSRVGRKRGASEATTTTTSVDEHLQPLEGRCFYYSNGDWWTYELCYKDRASQFHREGTTRVSSFSLGRFDRAATERLESERNATGDVEDVDDALLSEDRRYHAHVFTGGAKCEDVGAAYEDLARESEVRFVCAEDGGEGLSAVEEPATCKYILTFRTSLACNAKELRPNRPEVEHIQCSLVEDQDQDDARATSDDDGARRSSDARDREESHHAVMTDIPHPKPNDRDEL